MACGTPVLAADASSLPEVVGDAGEFFAPGDPALLARRIAEITAAPERRAAMRERGLARAADFSWDRTARRVLEVYREALRMTGDRAAAGAGAGGGSREHRHRRPQGGRLRHRHARAQPRAPPGPPRPLGRVGPLPPPRRRGAAPRGRSDQAGAGALRRLLFRRVDRARREGAGAAPRSLPRAALRPARSPALPVRGDDPRRHPPDGARAPRAAAPLCPADDRPRACAPRRA